MTIENKAKPVAEGSFSTTPFAHILIYLLNKRLSGTLDVTEGEQSAAVYFRDGLPAKVRSSVPGRQLGRVLQIMKLVNDEQLAACEREIEKKGGLQGQILVRQGVIDTPTLVRALREQMLLKLTDIFAMTEGSYAFYEHLNRLSGFGPDEVFPIDPYAVLMAGLRAYGERLNLGPACDSLKEKWLTIENPEQLRRFRPNHPEKAILRQMLSSPQKFDLLLRVKRYHPKVLRSTLYTLMITNLLGVHEHRPAIATRSPKAMQEQHLDTIPPPPPGQDADPQLAEQRAEILRRAEEIPSQNYFEMLGLERGAPPPEVRKAFFRLARELHPDKLPRALVAELKETIQYVFSNLSFAHATLIDGEAREQYEKALREGEQRTDVAPVVADQIVQDALVAENAFQKALVFLRRGQTAQAEELVAEARKRAPMEGEYAALEAHLTSLKRDPGQPVDDLIETLRKAVTTNPRSERANLFLAQMLRRKGAAEEALTYFDKALRINPANVEAARELRIAQMRGKAGEPDKGKGLLGRFFKGEPKPG